MKAITIKQELTFKLKTFKGFGFGVVRDISDYHQRKEITYHILFMWGVLEVSINKYKKLKKEL